MNKMRYGAIGAFIGLIFGLVLYYFFPSLLMRDTEINSQYYISQFGTLYYPGGVGGSIFAQRAIIVYLGIIGFGIGYLVGKVREKARKE